MGKRNINKLIGKKEHIFIITFTIITIGISFLILYSLKEVNREIIVSIIPGIMVEMLSILITYYFIAYLLSKSEEKKAKFKAYKLTRKRYKGLILDIGRKYVHLISRKPFGYKSNECQEMKQKIEEIMNNLEQLVPPDFMNEKIEWHPIVQKPTEVSSEIKKIEHQLFCKISKEENQKIFEEFISRYMGFLPDDLRESLLTVETLFQNTLATPLDFGLKIGFEVDQKEYIRNLKTLGEELIFLLEYFDEFENNQ